MSRFKSLEGKIIEITHKVYVRDKKNHTCVLMPGSILLVLGQKFTNKITAQVLTKGTRTTFPYPESQTATGIIEIFNIETTEWKFLRTETNRAQDPNVLL